MADQFEIIKLLNDWRELKRVSSRTGVPLESQNLETGVINFRVLGTKLYPLPEQTTEDYVVRVFYYAKDENPSGEDDLENGWMREFADLFIAEVGMRLAADLEDDSALRYFMSMREEARANYDEKVEEERHATEVLSF